MREKSRLSKEMMSKSVYLVGLYHNPNASFAILLTL